MVGLHNPIAAPGDSRGLAIEASYNMRNAHATASATTIHEHTDKARMTRIRV